MKKLIWRCWSITEKIKGTLFFHRLGVNVEGVLFLIKEVSFVKRFITYIIGLFILALGVSVSINANLGVSPVSALGYILSRIFPAVSIGTFINITFAFFLVIQILVLKRRFKVFMLTQLVSSTIFGLFVDLTNWIIGDFRIPTYAGQLFMLVISIVMVALGIILFVDARITPLPLEGMILAITRVVSRESIFKKFHVVKIIADCALVAASIILSLIFLHNVVGIREGTVITAVLVGKVIPYIRKFTNPALSKSGVRINE